MIIYFKYTNNEYSMIPGKRPSNQNKPQVLKKIKKRLQCVCNDNPNMQLTDLQKCFVEKIEQQEKIDIAHNIAISPIMKGTEQRMNDPLYKLSPDTEEFVDNILSTEDEEGKKKVKQFFKDLSKPQVSSKAKIEQASAVVDRLNRASKNLIPGYSSTNRSIQSYRDPHLILDEHHEFVEISDSQRLAKSGARFIDKYQPGSYGPRTKANPQGETMFQSSSVSKNPKESYYVPAKRSGKKQNSFFKSNSLKQCHASHDMKLEKRTKLMEMLLLVLPLCIFYSITRTVVTPHVIQNPAKRDEGSPIVSLLSIIGVVSLFSIIGDPSPGLRRGSG